MFCQLCGLTVHLFCCQSPKRSNPDTKIWSRERIKCSTACCVQVSSHFPLWNAKKWFITIKNKVLNLSGQTSSHTKKAGSWTQQAWAWGFRCHVLTLWGLTTYNSTHRNYSIWFVSQNTGLNQRYTIKNRCFHAGPGSFWEDNSRNCRLCRTSKNPEEVTATSAVRKSVTTPTNDQSRAGHVQAFARGGESPKDNTTLLWTFPIIPGILPKIRSPWIDLPLANLKMYKCVFSRTDHRVWVVVCVKWWINICMLFKTTKRKKKKTDTVHATC